MFKVRRRGGVREKHNKGIESESFLISYKLFWHLICYLG